VNPEKFSCKSYFNKMKGGGKSPPAVSLSEICWSWIGALLGISAVSYLHFNLIITSTDLEMLVGSFGASATLIYGAIKSPLAQPRNFLGGHIISAIIGVACFQFIGMNHPWLTAALAVATALAAMHATKTLHPPGGATALIAVIGSDRVHDLGFLYAIMPVGAGALIMLIVALIVNNIPKNRSYPDFWF
jgi:CBS-domain-containing membrane protein